MHLYIDISYPSFIYYPFQADSQQPVTRVSKATFRRRLLYLSSSQAMWAQVLNSGIPKVSPDPQCHIYTP